MTKKIIAVCLFTGTILLFTQCKQPENTPQSESQPDTMEQKQNNLTGGWKSIEVSETVKELAAYVLAEKQVFSPIKAISNATSQVVSGRNYQFQIHLQNGESWEAQVYVNLQKERSITSFRQIDD